MAREGLRKRAAGPAAAEPAAKKTKAQQKPQGVVKKTVAAVKEKVAAFKAVPNGSSAKDAPEVGDFVDLTSFGGEFETQDGKKVTMKELVDESKAGVVLFTYPKASTPGW